jgi:hypothetical protein
MKRTVKISKTANTTIVEIAHEDAQNEYRLYNNDVNLYTADKFLVIPKDYPHTELRISLDEIEDDLGATNINEYALIISNESYRYFNASTKSSNNGNGGDGNTTDGTGGGTDGVITPESPSTGTGTGNSDVGYNSYGLLKTSIDETKLNSLFTYKIPKTVWIEFIDNEEQTSFLNATSINGKLNLESTNTLNKVTRLSSFRNVKYEPNRGNIYATSCFLPNPTDFGIRRFGYFTLESGAFFELIPTGLFGVIRTTVDGITSDDRYLLDTNGIDLTKGNSFDIQMQWRGVGNYNFIINRIILLTVPLIGTRLDLSMYNPSNPASFECTNLGDNVIIQSGCVDVSSEGGRGILKTYGSIGITTNNGQVSSSNLNVPIIAMKSIKTINGLINTRDTLLMAADAYADQIAVVRIWRTRDLSAINPRSQTWKNFKDGHLQYIEYETDIAIDGRDSMTFDTTKAELIYTSVTNQNTRMHIDLLFNDNSQIYIHPGDLFIFTIHNEIGTSLASGITVGFAEEI